MSVVIKWRALFSAIAIAACGGRELGTPEDAAVDPPVCAAPNASCGATCVDITSDPINCGSCGNVCDSSTPYCIQSTCKISITPTQGRIAAGFYKTCGITNGGVLKCWGVGGLVGDGTMMVRTTPVAIGVANADAVCVDTPNTCAHLSSGEIACWGEWVGDGTKDLRTSPVYLPLSGVAQVAVGVEFTCARLANGTVQCWGGNDGELGDGTTISRTLPAPVLNVSTAVDLAAGTGHACVVLQAGAVQCWGRLGRRSVTAPSNSG
jgi:hypothetical protein